MSRGNRAAALAALNGEVLGWQVDQEMFDAAVAELAGLNRTNWRCLDILFTRGRMTAGQLAEAAHLTTGAVTAVVDHLEAAGYVRRVRDTVDRRRVIIETTAEIGRRSEPVYGPLVAEGNEVLGVFDADQLAIITDFVRRTRGLLDRHTTRLHAMLAEQRAKQPRRPAATARRGGAPDAKGRRRARSA
jgi:DNA-binding MarR family transcriptional regulator